jgi:uncharacterized protein YigE (DUF2233 family)
VIARALALLALSWAGAAAAECGPVEHRGRSFTLCSADLTERRAVIRLADDAGAPLGDFAALEAAEGAALLFATNGGMYHPDRSPVGLYVEEGRILAPLVTSAGPGNFGMLPNGVLCLRDDRADVIESRAFAADPPPCDHATQSGPMLVIDGALHPRFIEASPYLKRRNAAGVSPDGRTLHLVVSDEPVSFHELATLYRDVLGVRDALYLDGSVSRLHAPALGRSDPGRAMGPMIAVTDR